MRTKVIFISIALLLCVNIHAQDRRPLELSIAGGISLPAGPDGFNTGWKIGPGALFGVGYEAASNIHIMAAAEYHVFPHDPALPDILGTDKGRKRIFLFGMDGFADERLGGGPVDLLVVGGIGVAHMTVSQVEDMGSVLIKGEAETGFSLAVGGGFTWDVGEGTTLFVCGRYVGILAEGEGTSFFPVMIGCRF